MTGNTTHTTSRRGKWAAKPLAERIFDLQQKAAYDEIVNETELLKSTLTKLTTTVIHAVDRWAYKLSDIGGYDVTSSRLMLLARLRDELDKQMEIQVARALSKGQTLSAIARASDYDRTGLLRHFQHAEELAKILPPDPTTPVRTDDGTVYHAEAWHQPRRKRKDPTPIEGDESL